MGYEQNLKYSMHFHRRSWSVRKGPSMPDKRFGHCAVLLQDNKHVLVTGGHNGEDYVRSGILWSIEEETWLKGSVFNRL